MTVADARPAPRARAARWLVPFVMALIVGAGAVYALVLGDALRYPDEREYLTLAEHLATRHRFTLDGTTPTAYRSPGYPLVLAPVVALGGPMIVLRLLNFLALALSAYLLHLILRRAGFPIAAQLAPLLALGYPVLFYTAGTLYPQTIGTTLFLLTIALVARPEGRARDAILAGLAFGYLILTVPTFLPKLPLFAATLPILRGRRAVGPALIIAATALAVVCPWMIRNTRVMGSFVPLTTNSGYNLLLSNSEQARPNAGPNVDISRYTAAAPPGEVPRDAFYRDSAIAWAGANKGRAARLYARKVVNYFNVRNELYVGSERSPLRDAVMALTYGPLLLLFALRLLGARRYPLSRLEGFLVALYLANAFIDAVGITRIRYRLPFDPLLIAVVAIFVETLYRRHARAPAGRPALSARRGTATIE